jgi:hypothetical protein
MLQVGVIHLADKGVLILHTVALIKDDIPAAVHKQPGEVSPLLKLLEISGQTVQMHQWDISM